MAGTDGTDIGGADICGAGLSITTEVEIPVQQSNLFHSI